MTRNGSTNPLPSAFRQVPTSTRRASRDNGAMAPWSPRAPTRDECFSSRRALCGHTLAVVAGRSVVVLGGGVSGLATALLLARSGHRVTVVERDDLDVTDALTSPLW